MTNADPYISIVATARNDNHGGDLLHRMQIFVDGLVAQCARHDLPAELVLVEWNPPENAAGLGEALEWPSDHGACRIRIIRVPRSIHSEFRLWETLPLFQMIAKNVGIRRSTGRFILATNVDLLFSDELMHFLATKRLKKRFLYRIDRHDVPAEVPLGATIDEQLRFCLENVTGVYERFQSRDLVAEKSEAIEGPAARIPRITRRIPSGIKQSALYQQIARRELRRRQLHLNASGDFTLLARGKWMELRGYAELELFSMHLDSLLCHAAAHAGVRERILQPPMRIFHLVHSSGWDARARSGEFTDIRLDPTRTPQLTYDQLLYLAVKMREDRQPLVMNHEHWGLAAHRLEEIDPVAQTSVDSAVSQ